MAHIHTSACGPTCDGGGSQEIILPDRDTTERYAPTINRQDAQAELADLLDSEVDKITEVMKRLIARFEGQIRDPKDFDQEAKERFAEIGFKVEVIWYKALGLGQEMNVPEVSVVARIDPKEFDHEQMAWEVQHDVLGVDQPGSLQADGTLRSPDHSTSFATPRE